MSVLGTFRINGSFLFFVNRNIIWSLARGCGRPVHTLPVYVLCCIDEDFGGAGRCRAGEPTGSMKIIVGWVVIRGCSRIIKQQSASDPRRRIPPPPRAHRIARPSAHHRTMATTTNTVAIPNGAATTTYDTFRRELELPPLLGVADAVWSHELFLSGEEGHSLLWDMSAVAGPWAKFDVAELTSKLSLSSDRLEAPWAESRGMGMNLFLLNLGADAMQGVPVSIHDVTAFQEQHFAYVPEDHLPMWPHVVTACASPEDADKLSHADLAKVPLRGIFDKISMDVMVFAFLREFWSRLEWAQLSGGPLPFQFCKAARHVPVDIVSIPLTVPERVEAIFVASVNIVEQFRKQEEAHAAGAWQMCHFFAAARSLKKSNTTGAVDDIVTAATGLLSQIDFAQSSEYKVRGSDKDKVKSVQTALNVHDRVLDATCGDILDKARTAFGNNSPLSSMTKLTRLVQVVQTAAKVHSVCNAGLLRRVVQLLYRRLLSSSLCQTETVKVLAKTEIPRCIVIALLIAEATTAMRLDEEDSAEVKTAISELAIDLTLPCRTLEGFRDQAKLPSTRCALGWVIAVLSGRLDAALVEIVHQECAKKTP